MKTAKNIIAAACAAIAFTSCDKEQDTSFKAPIEATFTSGIEARASGNTWTAGDRVGIFMKTAGQPLASGNISMGADNRSYTSTAGITGTLTPSAGDQKIYYPQSGDVDFIAYCPYLATITAFAYPLSVATQTTPENIDVLWSNNATSKNKNSTGVSLTFVHKLTQLVINTTAGEGLVAADLAAMSVVITGMNTTASLNLATGVVSAEGTTADIATKTATAGGVYRAIVLPVAYTTAGTAKIEFRLNNVASDVFLFDIPATTLAAGNTYTWNIIVQRTPLLTDATITAWQENNPETGIAE